MTPTIGGNLITPVASLVLATWLSLFTGAAVGQEVAVIHCQGSCPQYGSPIAASNAKVVIHHLYAAGLNRYNRRADWVAYRLVADAMGIASLLPRDWQPDRLAGFAEISELADLAEFEPEDDLPAISTAASAYGSVATPPADEFKPVRLAPLTGFAGAPYWAELNNTSNMLPMPSALRLGAWLRLEQSLNSLVKQQEEVYVIAGPVYYNGTPPGSETLKPGENLAGYFKIVSTDSAYAGFLFPQDLPQTASFCEQVTSIGEIEDLTGLTLLPGRSPATAWNLLAELGCAGPVGP